MTEIDHDRRRAAESRALGIRFGLRSFAEALEEIATAYRERDWLTLGYESWDAYVHAEFGDERVRLSPEQREQMMSALRAASMPTRAIAVVLGVDQKTVQHDNESRPTTERSSGEENPSPDDQGVASDHEQSPKTVVGRDGKVYPARRSTPASRPVPEPEPDVEPDLATVDMRTGEIVAEADEHEAEDARRDEELDAEMAETAQRFRRNFSAVLARADDVWQFDPDRIAEVYAGDYDQAIRPFLQEMARWCDRVHQAHRQHRSGLRVVQGGVQ